jgi:hypothetical protein
LDESGYPLFMESGAFGCGSGGTFFAPFDALLAPRSVASGEGEQGRRGDLISDI